MILWIDQNTFASGLLEKVFKTKNLAFYTLPSAKDFAYVVEDLKPELLVLDARTALESQEALRLQYESSEALRSLPVIYIDEDPSLEFVKKVAGIIRRPFDPFQIPDIIEKMKNN